MAFWVTYDHLGKLILASLLWAIPLLLLGFVALTAFLAGGLVIPLAVGAPAAVLCLAVALPVLSAGLAHMAKELIETRDGSVGDMFRGIRLYWRRAVGLGCIYLIAVSCLTTSAWFYASKLRDSAPWLGYGISAIALWGLLFCALTALLAPATLVQKKSNVLGTIKLTALIVLDNPFTSLGIALQVVGFTIFAVVVPPLFFFLYGGVVVVLASSMYELLARRYAALECAGDARAAADAGRGPVLDDEHDDYLNRGFRDFLFPWKG
ncbi:MAG: hypothetical protein JXR94_24145 [Candidatus Hydrogenedentes bacterium]|nr:hypothetical protein [Candidatus Hydrogenedentota bacterium]